MEQPSLKTQKTFLQRLTEAVRQPLTWGVVAWVLFFFLRAPWVAPGESAGLMAQAMGVVPPAGNLLHPIVTLVAQALAGIAPTTAAVTLFNLFAVLLGGLSVWCFCALVKAFFRFCISEQHSRPFAAKAAAVAVPVAAGGLLLSPSFVAAATHFQGQLVDFFLLLCVLFLVVRTLCDGVPRKLTMTAAVCGFVGVSAPTTVLFVPLFITGLILAYTTRSHRPTLRRMVTRILMPMGLGAAAMVVTAAALQLRAQALLDPAAELSFVIGAKQFIAAQGGAVYALLSYDLWLLLVLFGVLPGVLALLMSLVVGHNTRSFSVLGTYVTIAVLATVCFLPFDVTPFALAAEWQEVYPLAVALLTAFAVAFVCGMGVLLISVKRQPEGRSEVTQARVWCGRLAKVCLVAVPVLAVGFGGVRLCQRLCADAAVRHVPRETVDAILAKAQGRELWLLSDGVLDPYLAIRIAETEAPVTLLSFAQEKRHAAYVTAQLTALLERSPHLKACFEKRPELKQTLAYAINDLGGLHPFLQDWLRLDPTAETMFVTLAQPNLWLTGNRYPVPETLWYRGVATYAEQCAAKPVMPSETLPEVCDEMSYAQKAFVQHLRRQVSILTCYSAQILMTQRPAEAYALFRAAYDCDPHNAPAIVGAYTLLRTHALRPEKPQGDAVDWRAYDAECARLEAEEAYCRKEILASKWLPQSHKERLTNPNLHILPLDAMEQLLVAWTKAGEDPTMLFEDETLIEAAQRNVLGWRAQLYNQTPGKRHASIAAYQELLKSSENPIETFNYLCELVRLNIVEGKPEAAKTFLEQAKLAAQAADQYVLAELSKLSEEERARVDYVKAATSLEYTSALYYIAIERTDLARDALQRFLTRKPGDIHALALLASLQLQAGEIKQVRDITMKQLEAAAKTTDTYQIKFLQAQLAEAAQDYKTARTNYLRAYALTPNAHVLRDTILRMDMMLMDVVAAREHAKAFLTRDRTHTFSNYIMGSLALQENDLDRALFYLQAATASTTEAPFALAYNDLAETYRRRGRWADALTAARQAYAIEPNLAIAHETAASALLELNRYAEAHQELDTALTLSKQLTPDKPADPRIAITRARVFQKEGKTAEARLALSEAHKQYVTLDAAAKADFDTLAQQLNLRF